jgi:hypothetical protein
MSSLSPRLPVSRKWIRSLPEATGSKFEHNNICVGKADHRGRSVRRKCTASLIFVILTCFTGYICLRLWPREPLLLERARIVYRGECTAWPDWINDHELLICRSRRDDPGQFLRRDIATGREQPLPALNCSLRLNYNQNAAASSDGQWVLWDEGNNASPLSSYGPSVKLLTIRLNVDPLTKSILSP